MKWKIVGKVSVVVSLFPTKSKSEMLFKVLMSCELVISMQINRIKTSRKLFSEHPARHKQHASRHLIMLRTKQVPKVSTSKPRHSTASARKKLRGIIYVAHYKPNGMRYIKSFLFGKRVTSSPHFPFSILHRA